MFSKVIEYRADDALVSFVPVKDVPGFTHKVLLLEPTTRRLIKQDWLEASFNVTERAALYFYSKHVQGRIGQ